MLLANFPFFDAMWLVFIFFMWVSVVSFIVMCLIDNFRRSDHSGFAKASWTVFLLCLPLFGALVYQIARPPTVEWAGSQTVSHP